MKNRNGNHWKLIVLLLAFNLFFAGSVFGQSIPTEVVPGDDPEIFPFSQSSFSDPITEYTEDLFEITNEGTFDSDGNFVETGEEALLIDEDEVLIRDSKPRIPESYRQSAFEAYQESIIANWGGKREFTEHRLEGIRDNLAEELSRFETLGEEIEEIEKKFEPLNQEIGTLKNQIDLLNRQVLKTKNIIKNVELQIAGKQITIRDLMWDIQRSEIELDIQRKIVLDYIVLVYQEEEKFFNYYDEGSSTLKLLLADNSISENLLGRDYLKVLEASGRKVFYDLRDKKVALDEKRSKVQAEEAKFERLYRSLNQERRILQEGRHAKKELLLITQGEEERYQQLLDRSIRQRLESAIAIQNLQENLQFIEGKLKLLEESLEKVEAFSIDPEKTEALEKLEFEVIQEVAEEFADDSAEERIPKHQTFVWPVLPRAITAYYKDPTYPKRWGVHNAVDIRAKQFTEVRAPANAYVFQTKDNGLGYSYIILAHKNRLMTVYGHLAEIIAKPGTVVKQGDVIALTGGTPGTKGAGWQTTGPHLHFEVYYKGENVDPLDYLPVLELPIEYVPDRYLLNR